MPPEYRISLRLVPFGPSRWRISRPDEAPAACLCAGWARAAVRSHVLPGITLGRRGSGAGEKCRDVVGQQLRFLDGGEVSRVPPRMMAVRGHGKKTQHVSWRVLPDSDQTLGRELIRSRTRHPETITV